MKNIFYTDNIALAAYLLTQEVQLVDIREDSPHHFLFGLSDPQKCIQQKQQFLNNALAPARQLFSQREMLLHEIKGRD